MSLQFDQPYPKAIFFDLDGTLVDSIPDLAAAVDLSLEDLGFAPAGEDKVRLWVGQGAKKLVLHALGYAMQVDDCQITAEDCAKAHRLFLSHYAGTVNKSRLYPHVWDVLHKLKDKGIRLALITNKPQQFLPSLLDYLQIAPLFELVIAGDTLDEQKPSPLPLLHAMQTMRLSAGECLMVGDSANDILAAKEAGIQSVCVTYGYNHGEDPYQLPANVHIHSFLQLLTHLKLSK